MQLVGADEVFGLLPDAAVRRRQELGADGGIQDIGQHGGQRLIPAGIGGMAHQIPHQRFGDGAVDPIHRHMVAVVGGPAQRQLRKVAGADDDAVLLVGDIHQHLGALPRLGVFVGGVGDRLVVADIPEVLPDRFRDGNGAQRYAQPFAEDLGVAAGAVGGAEARHGNGDGIGAGTAQQIHGPDRDQQRQGGIQAAGNAQNGGAAADMGQPPAQALRLHGENGLAAFAAFGGIGRDEGVRIDKAGEGGLRDRQGEGDHGIAGRIGGGPGVGAAALGRQTADIQLGNGHIIGEQSGLRQQFAVFGDQIVAGKDHIGSGFAAAGIGVEVAGHQPGTLSDDEGAAVFRLADGLIAGRAVDQHRGAGDGVTGAGRGGDPKILADLDSQPVIRHLPAAEQQVGAEGHLLSQQRNHADSGRRGGEPAALVEFAVIGQVGFGDDAEELPAHDDGGAVVQLAARVQRKPHHGGEGKRPAGLQHRLQGGQGALLQGGLQQQIPAGIAAEPQLRQHQQMDAGGFGLPHGGDGLGGVVGTVSDPQSGAGGGDFDKSVFHGVYSGSGAAASFATVVGRRGRPAGRSGAAGARARSARQPMLGIGWPCGPRTGGFC